VFVRGSLKRFESVSAFFNECDIMQQRMAARQRDDDILCMRIDEYGLFNYICILYRYESSVLL
jgi:hypothetical protein